MSEHGDHLHDDDEELGPPPLSVAVDAGFWWEVTGTEVVAALTALPGVDAVLDDEEVVLVSVAGDAGLPRLTVDAEAVATVSTGTGPDGPFVALGVDSPGITLVVTTGDVAASPVDTEHYIDAAAADAAADGDGDETDEEVWDALRDLAVVPGLVRWTGLVRMIEDLEARPLPDDDDEALVVMADLISCACAAAGFAAFGVDTDPLEARLDAVAERMDAA